MSSIPTESTPLASPFTLVGGRIDAELATADLVKNWGWILTAGILNFVLGILALFSPIMATGVVLLWTGSCLFLVGIAATLAGLCGVTEYSGCPGSNLRCGTITFGLIQIALAVLIFKNPFAALYILTVLIAIGFLLDGCFKASVVMMQPNRHEVPGWFALLVSALASIVLSIIIVTALPESELYTIGVLVGVNLLSIGMGRIAIGFEGRNLARQQPLLGE